MNQYASEKLVEAVENQGFEPVICTSDVDEDGRRRRRYDDNPVNPLALVTDEIKPVLMKAMSTAKRPSSSERSPVSVALRNGGLR